MDDDSTDESRGIQYLKYVLEIYKEKTIVLRVHRIGKWSKPPFSIDAVNILDKSKNHKINKKSVFGMIGGTAAGLIGGGLAIAGAALIPVTLGTSISLMAVGAAVGVAGTSVNIAVSVDKTVREKTNKNQITLILDIFIKTQCQILKILAACLVDVDLDKIQIEHIKDAEIKEADKCVEDMRKVDLNTDSEAEATLIQHLERVGEYVDKLINEVATIPKVIENLSTSDLVDLSPCYKTMHIEQVKDRPTDVLLRLLYSCKAADIFVKATGESQPTLYHLLMNYIISSETATKPTYNLPAGVTVTKGEISRDHGKYTERAQLPELTGDLFKVGINILKISRAVSMANVLLAALDFDSLDITFLGDLQFNLLDNDKDDFENAFHDLTDLMHEVNQFNC